MAVTLTAFVFVTLGGGVDDQGASAIRPGPPPGPPPDRFELARPASVTHPPARHLAAPETATAPSPLPAGAADRPIVAPTSFDARPGPPAPPPRLLHSSGPKAGGVWAVVVGIDDYPGDDHDLRAAAADARSVDAALAAYGVPAGQRVLLLDQQATGKNVRDSLTWLVTHAAANATAVVFYSGHVRQVHGGRDGDREAVDEALVAADGEAILDGELGHLLAPLEAGAAWIGVAGCYGAGFDDALTPGRVLTAASMEDELAYENSALGRSYLVEYMVRRAMLEGRAPGSVQEAFAWARAQLERDYPNRLPVMLDEAKVPLTLRPKPAPVDGRSEPVPAESTQTAPAQPSPPAAPAPQQPAPASPAPGGEPSCTTVLAVSLCSQRQGQDAAANPAADERSRSAEAGGWAPVTDPAISRLAGTRATTLAFIPAVLARRDQTILEKRPWRRRQRSTPTRR